MTAARRAGGAPTRNESAVASILAALPVLVLPIRARADSDGQNARINRWAAQRRKEVWAVAFGLRTTKAGWPTALPWPHAVVTITCIAARGAEPDDDNNAGNHKCIRDLIAKRFGVGDGPRGPITWRYSWQRGPDGTRIECEAES